MRALLRGFALIAPLLATALWASSVARAGAHGDRVVAQASGPQKSAKTSVVAKSASAALLAAAKSWGYQLRGIDPEAIARSPYDIVVVDFADREKPFTPAEIQTMRSKPDGGRRIILAYLSIGEAERYRYYWQSAWYLDRPAWLGPENPEWRGNFPVRFWDPDWQKIIMGTPEAYLDRIIAAGFDGAYLDRVDVHSNWEAEKPDAEQLMVSFVSMMSAYAKSQRPDFLIVPQNAEELLENDDYLKVIDAVAKEDLLFGIDHGEGANAADTIAHSAALLKRAKKAGKTVMVVEYLCGREEITKTERRISQEFGFLAYLGPRTLHSLGMGQEDYCLPPGSGGRRIALLFGSSAYLHAPQIKAPAGGVKALAVALRQVGFTDVRERMDLGRDSISQELQRFAETARKAEWAIVYYAGLGMRLDGKNYLIPVNARLDRAGDIEREGIPLDEVELAIEPAKHVRLAFVEACRANPFLQKLQRRGMTQSAAAGILPQPSSRAVTLGFASRCDGSPADADGEIDVYSKALARHLTTPGLELPWLLERVRDSVLRATNGSQEPVHLGAVPDSAIFAQAPPQITPPLPPPAR